MHLATCPARGQDSGLNSGEVEDRDKLMFMPAEAAGDADATLADGAMFAFVDAGDEDGAMGDVFAPPDDAFEVGNAACGAAVAVHANFRIVGLRTTERMRRVDGAGGVAGKAR